LAWWVLAVTGVAASAACSNHPGFRLKLCDDALVGQADTLRVSVQATAGGSSDSFDFDLGPGDDQVLALVEPAGSYTLIVTALHQQRVVGGPWTVGGEVGPGTIMDICLPPGDAGDGGPDAGPDLVIDGDGDMGTADRSGDRPDAPDAPDAADAADVTDGGVVPDGPDVPRSFTIYSGPEPDCTGGEIYVNGEQTIVGLALDAPYLYWAGYRGIKRVDLRTGGPAQTVVTVDTNFMAVAVANGYAYYTRSNGLYRQQLDMPQAEEMLVDGLASPQSVALSGSTVYVLDSGMPGTTTAAVHAWDLPAGPARLVQAGLATYSLGLAVAGGWIYVGGPPEAVRFQDISSPELQTFPLSVASNMVVEGNDLWVPVRQINRAVRADIDSCVAGSCRADNIDYAAGTGRCDSPRTTQDCYEGAVAVAIDEKYLLIIDSQYGLISASRDDLTSAKTVEPGPVSPHLYSAMVLTADHVLWADRGFSTGDSTIHCLAKGSLP
jgi:hypothetical protein